jgi:hypothetical protein
LANPTNNDKGRLRKEFARANQECGATEAYHRREQSSRDVWPPLPAAPLDQLFGFGKSLRMSLNSPGPFRSRCFRFCRSSALADGSLSLSIC